MRSSCYTCAHVDCPLINAGDGKNAHPTQALLDLFTIMEHFDGNVKGKRIAIVGDARTSRVAGSNKKLLPRFGIDVCFVAPDCFKLEGNDFKQYDNLSEIIDDIDIVMSLRTQLEDTMNFTLLPFRNMQKIIVLRKKFLEIGTFYYCTQVL